MSATFGAAEIFPCPVTEIVFVSGVSSACVMVVAVKKSRGVQANDPAHGETSLRREAMVDVNPSRKETTGRILILVGTSDHGPPCRGLS